jgi:MFS family permease
VPVAALIPGGLYATSQPPRRSTRASLAISAVASVAALVIAGWFCGLYGYSDELDRALFGFGVALMLLVGVAARLSRAPRPVGYLSFTDARELTRAQQQSPLVAFVAVGATAALIVVPQRFGEWKTLPALAGSAFCLVLLFAALGPWWLVRGYQRAVARWNAAQEGRRP